MIGEQSNAFSRELLMELTSRGVEFVPSGESLLYTPQSAVTTNLLSRLGAHKVELIALLEKTD